MSTDARSMPAMPALAHSKANPGWRLALPLVVVAMVALLALHASTVESIVAICSTIIRSL